MARQTNKKSKNSKRKGSNSNLKQKIISPTQSTENVVSSSVQSNSIENVQNLYSSIINPETLDIINPETLDNFDNLTKLNTMPQNDKPASYEITTTYKTEIIESSIDPETGDIIEVITEVYVTDTMVLSKQEEEFTLISPSTQDLALEEVLKQLNMGTEICKELLG
ncbi:hypothetical protein BCR36DRAFT_583357 [Piromyces finnis]|uniref:Uncharacterized protein n=1 Tax=Piromyces finnis TaxID=1754191 RepID=A0A1Y1VB88_9FUNG|nr:hypothetical protein BCR36DRAFT_583357 [Piromyces finnis]|eukprot:ORX50777.1 hypothetical protein BCR36DRAFT_583357 [Piromyces finnis]